MFTAWFFGGERLARFQNRSPKTTFRVSMSLCLQLGFLSRERLARVQNRSPKTTFIQLEFFWRGRLWQGFRIGHPKPLSGCLCLWAEYLQYGPKLDVAILGFPHLQYPTPLLSKMLIPGECSSQCAKDRTSERRPKLFSTWKLSELHHIPTIRWLSLPKITNKINHLS